jgi:hypothetical protein
METLEQFRKAAFMYCIFNYKFNTRHKKTFRTFSETCWLF